MVRKSAVRQLPSRFCRPLWPDCGETVVSAKGLTRGRGLLGWCRHRPATGHSHLGTWRAPSQMEAEASGVANRDFPAAGEPRFREPALLGGQPSMTYQNEHVTMCLTDCGRGLPLDPVRMTTCDRRPRAALLGGSARSSTRLRSPHHQSNCYPASLRFSPNFSTLEGTRSNILRYPIGDGWFGGSRIEGRNNHLPRRATSSHPWGACTA